LGHRRKTANRFLRKKLEMFQPRGQRVDFDGMKGGQREKVLENFAYNFRGAYPGAIWTENNPNKERRPHPSNEVCGGPIESDETAAVAMVSAS
jgi:hypothetical protein